jgi:hypothetical protein
MIRIKKNIYETPAITKILMDSEISLQLSSVEVPEYENEGAYNAKPSWIKNDPYKMA